LLAGLKPTDIETYYKLAPKRMLDQITITENRFGIEPEITAKLAHMKPKLWLVEVPMSYVNRSYTEGKKLAGKMASAPFSAFCSSTCCANQPLIKDCRRKALVC